MVTRQITHQNIFRVMTVGFALVILLLLAAAAVGIRNIRSIQENAAGLVRDQEVTNRLIGELHSQQTALTEVFSVLARDPDSVDYDGIMQQLGQADKTSTASAPKARARPSSSCGNAYAKHRANSPPRQSAFSRRTRPKASDPWTCFATMKLSSP